MTSIALSDFHGCALTIGGRVSCWGGNMDGQLGRGFRSTEELAVAEARGLPETTAISAGNGYTCAVSKAHQVLCWGTGYTGQLGRGVPGFRASPVRVQLR